MSAMAKKLVPIDSGTLIPAPENWPDDLAPEAFHGIAGEIVRVMEPFTEADPAAILGQILVGFSNLAGRQAFFEIESARIHLNEFLVLVGKSARGRKGTSWARAKQVLREGDPGWLRERTSSGLSSGEGLIEALARKEETKPDKRLLVVETEFAGILKQAHRQGNILSIVIRNAWDSGTLQVLTRKAARADDVHLSIIGHITAEELRDTLTKTEQANGFANRFLWICTRRRRLLPDGRSQEEHQMKPLFERFALAAETARGIERITRSPEATELWREIYAEVSAEETGMVGTILERAEGHITRLSGTYALLDRSDIVKPEHLKAAMAFWEYCERSVRYIFGQRKGTPIRDTIVSALEKAPDGLGKSEIMELWHRHQSSAKVEQALRLLAHQRVVIVRQTTTGGRPKDVWMLREYAHDAAPRGFASTLRGMLPQMDDKSVDSLWSACRTHAPDATADEIAHAFALQMPAIRSGRIGSPVGFVLSVVPQWFEGTALADHRAAQKPASPQIVPSKAERIDTKRRLLAMYGKDFTEFREKGRDTTDLEARIREAEESLREEERERGEGG